MEMQTDFRKGHRKASTAAERLDRMSIPEPMSGCVLWLGSVDGSGYGHLRTGDGSRRVRHAHKVAWELVRGPVPPGLVIDHKCRVRSCINPEHMRAVTFSENVLCGDGPTARNARRTHCLNGHPFDVVRPSGVRACKRCHNARTAKAYAKSRMRGI